MLRKSLLCAALLFVGCDNAKNDEASFREGLPSREMVEMKAPKKDGQGLAAFYGEGQTADHFALTVGAAVTVNGGTLWVLGLIETIVKYPPSSIEGDVAVWGPYSDDSENLTWKLTVTRTDDHSYSWVMDGKAKTANDSGYVTVLSGTHTAAVNADGERMKGFGSGEFLIDWERRLTLPGANLNEMGTGEIRYSRTDAAAVASVEADFQKVRDEAVQGGRVDANYRYKQAPGAGGELDFVIKKNIDLGNPDKQAPENLAIKSRWGASGAGRSDIKLSGGDLRGEATLSECWDSNFLSVYYTASYNPFIGYGAVSACGNFSTAVYSTP
ncbi:hypothetical protein HPC49_09635 [Pyxidicoccus fallax]|uniref:Lipoprotein n=1 Tax=Pyxidicoccus fallax TaxID=394095 RepID=A0A848LDX7_9BACT|nr:hypothetical protein [Pyxidicoccus fallax]NMO16412.1 hypothetical protein [Pyxidicoccus fallax]NPC78504.1 hypothetical protein [Pyxidicoccus fallax]